MSRVVSLEALGADPSGRRDSTEAFRIAANPTTSR